MSTPTLEIAIRETDGKKYALVALAGILDAQKLEEIAAQLDPLLESEHSYLVLDLGAVDLVSSRAMSYLQNLHRRASELEKQVALVNANSEILEILEFIGLAKLVFSFDEEKKFVEAIRRGEI